MSSYLQRLAATALEGTRAVHALPNSAFSIPPARITGDLQEQGSTYAGTQDSTRLGQALRTSEEDPQDRDQPDSSASRSRAFPNPKVDPVWEAASRKAALEAQTDGTQPNRNTSEGLRNLSISNLQIDKNSEPRHTEQAHRSDTQQFAHPIRLPNEGQPKEVDRQDPLSIEAHQENISRQRIETSRQPRSTFAEDRFSEPQTAETVSALTSKYSPAARHAVELDPNQETLEPTRKTRFEPLVQENLTSIERSKPSLTAPAAAAFDRMQSQRNKADQDRYHEPAHQQPDEIRIHIGRVEVTAVAQATPRPAPASPRKSPSLDEYLKRRSGRAG